MDNFLIQLMEKYGLISIAVLIFIENIFPPIPSEVVLLFGGFMTTYTNMDPWSVMAAATIGSYLGACVLYGVGSFLSKERLKRLVSGRLGKVLRLKPEHIDKANDWFTKRGAKSVLICRCVPIVRSLISIPAGMTKMSFPLFSVLTILGSSVWNTVLVWLGNISGNAWESWLKYIGWYSKAVIAVIIIGGATAFFVYRNKKKKKAEFLKRNKEDDVSATK